MPPSPANSFGEGVGALARAWGRLSDDVQRIGVTTIAFASSGSTTLFFNLVLVRALSPAAYGGVARTFSLGMGVAQLSMAGLSPAIAREVANAASDERRFARARAGTSVLVCACSAISCLYVPLALAGLAPTGATAVLFGWALSLVYAMYFGLKMLLFVLDCSTRYAVLELCSDVVFFATLALLATIAPSAGVLAFSIAYALFVVVAIHLITRQGAATERIGLDKRTARYTGWSSLATYASIGRFAAAVSLTGALAGSAVAGRMAALLALVMPFFLIPQAAAVLTFAKVARARASGEDSSSRVQIMCRMAGWASALLIPVCCLFARDLMQLFLGKSYGPASTSFIVLMLCVAPQIAALPVGQALAAQGAVVANACCALFGFSLMIGGALLLVPHHGVLGGAIAFGASMLVTGVIIHVLGHARFGIGLRDGLGTVVAITVGLAAALAGGAPLPVRVLLATVLILAVVRLSSGELKIRTRPTGQYS